MKKKFFKATDKRLFCCLITVLLCSCMLLCCTPLASAEIQVTPLSNCSFIGNDVDSKGVLWVGDKNFGLWKSTDNGASFQLVYKMPGTVDAGNSYGGLVWTVFVDSRDY